MGNPVVHFEILGEDPGRLHEFFGKLFDWKIAKNPMGYGMVDAGGGGIGGGIGPAWGQGHVTLYVQVDDCEAYLDRAEALGGHVVMRPREIPGGPTVALFTDPEGHVIGLVKGM